MRYLLLIKLGEVDRMNHVAFHYYGLWLWLDYQSLTKMNPTHLLKIVLSIA